MNIRDYLDSTYLKNADQAGISEEETWEKVKDLTLEAIDNEFFAVMIRPEFVSRVKELIVQAKSHVLVGTVIGFHEGTYSLESKLAEATKAIADGADELDFVINYPAFLAGDKSLVEEEVRKGNELVLDAGKTIKWIIEAAALSDAEIVEITQLIRDITVSEFGDKVSKVFVKSSTGFYQTAKSEPNGATDHNISLMLANAGDLPVKAAGGVRTLEEAKNMVDLGVKRIGTSSGLAIVQGLESNENY